MEHLKIAKSNNHLVNFNKKKAIDLAKSPNFFEYFQLLKFL